MGRAVGQTLPRKPRRLVAAGVGAAVLAGALLTVGLLVSKSDPHAVAPPAAVVPKPEVPTATPPPETTAVSPPPAPPVEVKEPAAPPPVHAVTAEAPAHTSAPVRRVKHPKASKTSPGKAVLTRRPIED